MFCGTWASKSNAGDARKLCGGPGDSQGSQKGAQKVWEDVNRVPSTRYSTSWRTLGRHSGRPREHVQRHLDVQKWSRGRMKAVRRPGDQAGQPERRPGGRQQGALHALQHILAHFWATLRTAPGACSVVFGRPKVVRATQESSTETLEPGRTVTKASRRPGKHGFEGDSAQKKARRALGSGTSCQNIWIDNVAFPGGRGPPDPPPAHNSG